ncbi:hypothetical protein [Agathobacter rectalis]|uniref:hypothetical protein n=1 Tax=Agathobacter rectalis TaxID=39491 RepID=UPI00156EDEB5|nr:hypothetical protein [Agathobacter rectalis]
MGISAVSATFSRLFSGFLAEFGELFWGFLLFQLFFAGFFPAFWLGLGSCFGDFCCFSYFLPVFFRLFGLVWGAVLGISAVSAIFCRFFSGFLTEFGLFLLHLVGTKSELPLLAFWPAHLL